MLEESTATDTTQNDTTTPDTATGDTAIPSGKEGLCKLIIKFIYLTSNRNLFKLNFTTLYIFHH